jgi:release factor glutamine methyltransferase
MGTKIKDYRTQFIQELSSIYDVGEAESFFYLILEEKQKLKRIDLALNFRTTQKRNSSSISIGKN